jgi:hypothetical protein
MKSKLAHLHRGLFLWIGGACFLAGSLVAGSYGLASSAAPGPTVSGTVIANQGTPGTANWPVSATQSGTWLQEITDGANVLGTLGHPLRTDPTGSTTQPVSGTVGLGAGSNDVGNVGISGSLPAGTNDIGTVHVAAPSPIMGSVNCGVADGAPGCQSSDPGLAAGTVLNTLSVFCEVAVGQHVQAQYFSGSFIFGVPLSFQESSGKDFYTGTLTNLGLLVQSGSNFLLVGEDYTASSGNGAGCTLNYIGTAP